MPRNLTSSAFMKPFVVLALPGMYLFYKYSQYKRQQQEQNRRRVTERELAHLNHKIDKLLSKLEENEPELATSQEDECVICVNAKATMQTSPCGHRVVCRKCFVKTIQMAVSQRLLPLRCVICRAKILRLKQSGSGGLLAGSPSSWSVPAPQSSNKTWILPSASNYSMSAQVPNSESLYSMASGSSSISGVSSASSSSAGSSYSGKCGASRNYLRQPTGSFRKSQTQSMKYCLQEYKEPNRNSGSGWVKEGDNKTGPTPARLPPIQEFQREFRLGKERSSSTRIRYSTTISVPLIFRPYSHQTPYHGHGCSQQKHNSKLQSDNKGEGLIGESGQKKLCRRCAQKIVTQLETSPPISNNKTTSTSSSSYFRAPLKPPNVEHDKKRGVSRAEASQAKQRHAKEDKRKPSDAPDPKQQPGNEENVENKDKKPDRQERIKSEKRDKSKEEKRELTKAEKKEQKKEAKAEKKNAKKEAKAEKKDKKE